MLSFAGEVQPWPMSPGSYGNYLLVQGEGVNYADDLACQLRVKTLVALARLPFPQGRFAP